MDRGKTAAERGDRSPGVLEIARQAAVFVIETFEDVNDRVDSTRARVLLKLVKATRFLLFAIAGYAFWLFLNYLFFHQVFLPLDAWPLDVRSSDTRRTAMFNMLAIMLVGPLLLLFGGLLVKFLFNIVDATIHRYLSRILRPLAAPALAIALGWLANANAPMLNEEIWLGMKKVQMNWLVAKGQVPENIQR